MHTRCTPGFFETCTHPAHLVFRTNLHTSFFALHTSFFALQALQKGGHDVDDAVACRVGGARTHSQLADAVALESRRRALCVAAPPLARAPIQAMRWLA